jgi:hypothetical protein
MEAESGNVASVGNRYLVYVNNSPRIEDRRMLKEVSPV